MALQSHRVLIAMREELRLLEDRYEASESDATGDEHVRELSMRSLKRLINQLKEEIARFEAGSCAEVRLHAFNQPPSELVGELDAEIMVGG